MKPCKQWPEARLRDCFALLRLFVSSCDWTSWTSVSTVIIKFLVMKDWIHEPPATCQTKAADLFLESGHSVYLTLGISSWWCIVLRWTLWCFIGIFSTRPLTACLYFVSGNTQECTSFQYQLDMWLMLVLMCREKNLPVCWLFYRSVNLYICLCLSIYLS